jgi:formylglycine-generating enzyme required for sulfatase activity
VAEGAHARCPRCRALVAGDYKFCPTCAYRLRVDVEAGPPVEAPRSGWKTAFFVAAGALVAAGCAALGVLLFSPGMYESTTPKTPATPTIRWPELLRPAITVDDIESELVTLPPGTASVYDVGAVRDFAARDPDEQDRIREALGGETIRAIVWYPLRAMKYEVTNGQYAEFLDDVQAHPDHVPRYWLDDAKARGQTFDLFRHVPRAWLVLDSAGEPTSWKLESDDKNLPVAQVSFVDAQGFAAWAADRLHLPLRLPLVMEWTRAARAGKEQNLWPWGPPERSRRAAEPSIEAQRLVFACNNIGLVRLGVGRVLPVQYVYAEPVGGGGGATEEGLFAMAGNVAEWAIDHDLMIDAPATGRPFLRWVVKPSPRYFACGGSFRSGIDDCTVESYEMVPATTAFRDDIGFRLVVTAP